MRLTPDLIEKADTSLNPTYEVEISLRGTKIPAIENLGVTEDYYEAIDLSDNEITKLENFPLLLRLKSIFLSNNRISRIAPDLNASIPNVHTIVLSNNRLNRLGDLDPLESLKSLKCLSLLNNPVTRVKHYRIYVINLLPNLSLLDFSKVKWKERLLARKVFGGTKGEKLRQMMSEKKTFVPGEGVDMQEPVTRTNEEIQAAISSAKTLADIQKVELALKTGSALPGASSVAPTPAEPTVESGSGSGSSSAVSESNGLPWKQPAVSKEGEAKATKPDSDVAMEEMAPSAKSSSQEEQISNKATKEDKVDTEMSEANEENADEDGSKTFKQVELKGRAEIVGGVDEAEVKKYTMAELKEFVTLNFGEEEENECKGKKKAQLVSYIVDLVGK